jgi:hypothetical protein
VPVRGTASAGTAHQPRRPTTTRHPAGKDGGKDGGKGRDGGKGGKD